MLSTNKRLTILSNLEYFAFYGLPDFDEEQRSQYFTFEKYEWELILKCSSLHTQVYCALQIGYFKAKKIFFRFAINKIPQADLYFILSEYFQNQTLTVFTVTKYEYYFQIQSVCQLFGYKLWSYEFLDKLNSVASYSVKRDITPNFIAHELLTFLQNEKITRPGYSTLQKIVSNTLAQERNRLKACLQCHLTEDHKHSLDQLLKNENTLSRLAALKQDAKSFGFSMMALERNKHDTLKPLYGIVKMILPHLDISQQNIAHYANLAHHYTIYDLDRFDEEQAYLYLLCYVFKRYQQINDNLMSAFDFHVKKLENEIKEKEVSHFEAKIDKQIGLLLFIYVDNTISDSLTMGEARKQAFKILPKETILSISERMVKKPQHRQEFQWAERDKAAYRYKRNLRSLLIKIDFESQLPDNSLLKAIHWMKETFTKKQSLSQQPFDKFPRSFISKRLEPHLLVVNQDEKPLFQADRYEILVYRQIVKQMETGALHIEDSIRHRTFAHDLVSLKDKEKVLKTLNIPWLKSPCEEQLYSLFKELDALWHAFNNSLKQGDLKHLKYDLDKKVILWVKPKLVNEKENKETLYDMLPICDIADVLRFVNNQTGFLSDFTPLQPRYNKQKLDENHLIAVLISQAMNLGNYKMAQTSDIPYHVLESTCQQYMRLATLNKAHDTIANAIARLSIFPHYTFDLDILYGSLDGQKYETITPTARARYSRKYYKKGRGVVAYTLLSNHVPIQCELIGAHEHESYFVFDIWYGNTSIINPSVLTGDMHSINKANFAILYWFGGELRPRFTNLKKELKHIFCGKTLSHYEDFLVQPVGQIDRQLITDQKENIDQVIATLALKEISQSTLIKKLCSLPPHNNTRKAIFEFDKLIRSIYTLKCILDPKILSDVHRSQNRIESYHNLRASISRVGGRKALLGHTDIEVEINNQCGRLIAGAIIYYNSFIQSRILERTPENNKKQLKILKKLSPVAWQNIHFTGHFTFYDDVKPIDIDKLIENVNF